MSSGAYVEGIKQSTTRGDPKIMSSMPYFAEIVQFMHKTTSCRLSDHWLVTQVNISSTHSLA